MSLKEDFTTNDNKKMDLILNEKTLTNGRLLARNTLFNLIGQGAPMVIALFAIPLLIKGLGTDRFGVLTLAWVVVGYFSLFDFGLGRALTKVVAEKLGTGRQREIPAVVWTTLSLMIAFGFLGGVIFVACAHWIVQDVLKVPDILKAETVNSFYLLAFSIPIVISTAGLRGILEAQQRFELVNVVRFIMGAFTYLGPLLVLPFSQSLFAVVGVLVAGRILTWLAHLFFCFSTMPELRQSFTIDRAVIKPLIHFGSWMTVTNIVGPLMVYLDRFIIGALLTVSAVAYYTTPYEVVTKLWIIPGAMVGVLLPAFSASFAHDRAVTSKLFGRVVKYIFLIMFPIALVIVTFAKEGLELWLGSEFARNSAPVLQWLAAGVFINSMAQVSFILLQGAGRPDLTAKIHLLELPFYLVGVWWLTGIYGIDGAAAAWTGRVTVDALFLFLMAWRLLRDTGAGKRPLLIIGLALVTLSFASLMIDPIVKGIFVGVTLLFFAVIAWTFLLAQEERMAVKNRIKMLYIQT